MEFRPCIDIHNGKVKQIVGSSLRDERDSAQENYVSEYDAAFYARYYKNKGLKGGHIILLNPPGSAYYEETREQAVKALREYPGGMQAGGGITVENAAHYIDAGASHVIVTSYVFSDGQINYENLKKLTETIGRDKIVLDLSCRKKDNIYYIVTDRWQKYTDVAVNRDTMEALAAFCSEFLIHAVDAEGKADGIERELVGILGGFHKIPITYAGGVHSFEDLEQLRELGGNEINVTIGSALDLFGGTMQFDKVLACLGR